MENLATQNLETDNFLYSGSSNNHQSQNQDGPILDYIGSQFGNEGNLQSDDTPMRRWQSSSDDRPVFWPPDE
jgi:hypothetical protein